MMNNSPPTRTPLETAQLELRQRRRSNPETASVAIEEQLHPDQLVYHAADTQQWHTQQESVMKDNCSKFTEPLLFDSVNVQLHVDIFFQQLIAHLLIPLVPLLLQNPRAQGFTFENFGLAFFNIILPLTLYVMLGTVTWLFFQYNNDAAIDSICSAFIMPTIYYLSHRMLVAIKYASLSRSEYDRFNRNDNMVVAAIYRSQIQSSTGWMRLDANVLVFELGAAAARIGARINRINFIIRDPESSAAAMGQFRQWNALMFGHEVIDFNAPVCPQFFKRRSGDYGVSVADVCTALLLKQVRNEHKDITPLNRSLIVYNLLNVSIVFIFYAVYFPHNLNAVDHFVMALFLLSTTIVNYMFSGLFFYLLYIVIVDVKRQLAVMQDLLCMIRLSDLTMHVEFDLFRSDSIAASAEDFNPMNNTAATATDGSTSTKFHDHRTSRRVQAVLASSKSSRPVCPSTTSSTTNSVQSPRSGDREDSLFDDDIDSTTRTTASTAVPATSTPVTVNTTAEQDEWEASSVIGEADDVADNAPVHIPRLWIDCEQNVVAWTHARLALQFLGTRFRNRLDLQVVSTIGLIVAIMIVCIVSLVLSDDPLKTFLATGFFQVNLVVTVGVLFLCIITATGSAVNDVFTEQTRILNSQSLRFVRKISVLRQRIKCAETCLSEEEVAATEKMIESLSGAQEAVSSMNEVIDVNTNLQPYKVVGMAANSAMTGSVLSVAFSYLTGTIGLLSNQAGGFLANLGYV